MEIPSEVPAKKTKRLTSVVWNHFERVRKADLCYAVCVHCKKKLSGSSNSGTTHLRNHLIRCLKRSNYDVSQILAAKRKRKENSLGLTDVVTYEEGQRKDEIVTPVSFKYDQEHRKEETSQSVSLASINFDQERSRLDLARMIMLHGYPLTMVDHVGFKIFVRNLQPLFEVMSSAIELDCMTIYMKEKNKVYEMIHNLPGRMHLAVDMWMSAENSRYMSLTAYYIDEEWKLQQKLLNFITLDPSQTDDMLAEVVIKCLTDWAIDRRLFSMTFDNFTAYDEMIFKIKDWISQNRPLVKNGQLFDVRCAARVIKAIVQDVIESLRDVIHKIRESVKYVRGSQATLGKFNEIAQQLGINTERRLLLDCPSQWNSTYFMLEAAVEYRGAFSSLQEHDSAYTTSLSEIEWDWANSVTGYLKLFVEVSNVFIGNKSYTANIYFPEICDIHVQLIEWSKISDGFLSSVALKMKLKFEKYWKRCSLTLAVAAFLDPRFKMKLMEYYYPQIYSGDAPNHIREVSSGIRELFNEYAMASSSLDPDSAGAISPMVAATNGTRDRLRGFDKFLHETSQSQSIASDLDKYLEEPVFPRNYDFSILNWWKVHTPRYPILSMMARDILGIPASTLGPELAFSNGDRLLDPHRSSLNPDTREALICGQDWLQVELEETNPSVIHSAIPLTIETV